MLAERDTRVTVLGGQLEEQRVLIGELTAQVADLMARVKQNSKNSSLVGGGQDQSCGPRLISAIRLPR